MFNSQQQRPIRTQSKVKSPGPSAGKHFVFDFAFDWLSRCRENCFRVLWSKQEQSTSNYFLESKLKTALNSRPDRCFLSLGSLYLTEGTLYFLEVLHVQEEDGGYFAVGVTLPNGTVIRPITTDHLVMYVPGKWNHLIQQGFIGRLTSIRSNKSFNWFVYEWHHSVYSIKLS